MNRALHLAPIRRVAAARLRIVRAVQRHDVAVGVLDHLGARDEIAEAQAHFAAWCQAEELARRIFHEVVALHPQLARERQRTRAASGRIGRIALRVEQLHLPLGVVRENHLERIEHAQHTRDFRAEIVAHRVFEGGDLHARILARHPDRVGECANRLRPHTAATQPRDRGHARIVPSVHMPFVHQAQQLALAQHRVVELEPRKLDLRGRLFKTGRFHQPIVDIAIVLELERAQRARDPLDRVAQAVRKIVQRVDLPLGAAPIMMRITTNAHEQRIAHDHVRMREIDLRAQYVRPIGEFTGLHAAQQVEILRRRTIPIGTGGARRRHRTTIGADLLFRLRVHIRLALLDQPFRDRVQLFEIVGGVVLAVPVEAEPAHVLLDRLDVLHVLRERIRIVEAQVAGAAVLARDAEVQADRLCVPHVQEAVGLGGEARGRSATEPAGGDVVDDQLANEVAAGRGAGVGIRHGSRVSAEGNPGS